MEFELKLAESEEELWSILALQSENLELNLPKEERNEFDFVTVKDIGRK